MTISSIALWFAPPETWDDSAPHGVGDRADRPASTANIDDQTLAARLQSGDAAAFDTLARRHLEALLHFASTLAADREAAEDIVQTVLARIWTRRAQFTPSGSVVAYLCAAIRNEALDTRRREATQRRVTARAWAEPLLNDAAPLWESAASANRFTPEIVAHLRHAFLVLPERYRTVLQLRYGQRLGYTDIAAVVGGTPKAAERLLARAIAALRRTMPPVDH